MSFSYLLFEKIFCYTNAIKKVHRKLKGKQDERKKSDHETVSTKGLAGSIQSFTDKTSA